MHQGQEQQEAIVTLPRLCTALPILAYADFKASFIFHTIQERKKKGIAYASMYLSRSEKNYPVHKLELLAPKRAITDMFHEYLCGTKYQVFTNNNPWIMSWQLLC